jgi:membrane fusion protein, multidrug efflux system
MSEIANSLKTKRKRLIFWYWGLVFVILFIFLLLWLYWGRFRAYTDDAYVEGNQVYITPLREGFVTSIHTDDTYLVKRGQLIIELDKTDAIIALNQAKKNLEMVVREVCQSFHNVFVYKSDIDVKGAEFVKTIQDFQHRAAVLTFEGVSREDYEHSVAALRASYYSMQMSKTLYKKALSLVQGTTIANHPQVLAAADTLRNAWVQLYRCNVYSPVEGLAAQRKIQVGMWARAGEPLMSIIPMDQIWVNANFKETQLRLMRIGQAARITSDFYGRNVVFNGVVVGLPGGAGNAFSLLPPQNLSGNWIKIVQRLPVRIQLDQAELKTHPLRVGLSMEVTVDLSKEGLLIPTSEAGSPHYQTTIFMSEETGDEAVIEEIIHKNTDPSLSQFLTNPLVQEPLSQMETLPTHLEKVIKDPCQFHDLFIGSFIKQPGCFGGGFAIR